MFGANTGATFGSTSTASSSFLNSVRFDDGSKTLVVGLQNFVVEDANPFTITLVLPINATSLLVAGMFKKAEKAVLASVTIGYFTSTTSSLSDDMPTHSLSSSKPTPTRTIEFRNARFESCEINARSQNAFVSQPTPTFGASPFGPQPPSSLPSVSNSIQLKFSGSTIVQSELASLRDVRLNSDVFTLTNRPNLPCFPGTTLIRSLGQNIHFAFSWNWFDMHFSAKTYWLYERKDRLIFRTLLMIRRFRNTALSHIDMNVLKIIFDLVATPVPVLLHSPDQLRGVQAMRAEFVELSSKEEAERVDAVDSAVFGNKPLSYFNSTVTVPRSLEFAGLGTGPRPTTGFSFGGQPAFGQPQTPKQAIFGNGLPIQAGDAPAAVAGGFNFGGK